MIRLERELAKRQEMGMSREEKNEYVKYFTGTFAVIGIVSAITRKPGINRIIN